MKKTMLFISLFVMLSFIPSNMFSQSSEVVLSTTVANGTSKTFVIPLQKYMSQGIIDSVVLSVYYKGELEDSTLALYRGIYDVSKTYTVSSTSSKTNYAVEYFSSSADTTITLATNLAAGVEGYTASRYKWVKGTGGSPTVSKTKLDGYNAIKGVLKTKLAGNDATDTGQIALYVARIYWTK